MKIRISNGLEWRGENYLICIYVDWRNGGRTVLVDILKPKWLIDWQDDWDGRHANRA